MFPWPPIFSYPNFCIDQHLWYQHSHFLFEHGATIRAAGILCLIQMLTFVLVPAIPHCISLVLVFAGWDSICFVSSNKQDKPKIAHDLGEGALQYTSNVCTKSSISDASGFISHLSLIPSIVQFAGVLLWKCSLCFSFWGGGGSCTVSGNLHLVHTHPKCPA